MNIAWHFQCLHSKMYVIIHVSLLFYFILFFSFSLILLTSSGTDCNRINTLSRLIFFQIAIWTLENKKFFVHMLLHEIQFQQQQQCFHQINHKFSSRIWAQWRTISRDSGTIDTWALSLSTNVSFSHQIVLRTSFNWILSYQAHKYPSSAFNMKEKRPSHLVFIILTSCCDKRGD